MPRISINILIMRFDVCTLVLAAFFARLSSGGTLPQNLKRAIKDDSRSSPAQQCTVRYNTVNTVKYNISQTWYPLLLPYGYFSCIKCECTMFNASAKVVCKKKQCNKKKCSNAHIIAGDCCKKCPDTSSVGQVANARPCTYIGKKYAHGTVWETADHNNGDLCTECSCSDGFVSCAIRICPKPLCSQPTKKPGTCCKHCPSNNKSINQSGCDSLGRFYQEGEQWYPKLSSYQHKCIVCICKNSKTHCSKVSCTGLNCSKSCCKTCKVPVTTTVAPTTIKSTTSIKQLVKYPDCYTGRLHIHNTTWTPIIAGQPLVCVTCRCSKSRVSCSRIICPQKYSCPKPVKKDGECCKQCKGQSPTKRKMIRLGWKNKRPCGKGNAWRVYEYTPANRSKTTLNDNEIHGYFIFESTNKDKVEVHTFRANNTHKDVRIKKMYKADLLKWKKISSPTMKLREIGIIKDARRQKLEARKRKKCTTNCVQSVKNLIQMVRLRSRWCRSPEPYGLRILERKSWKLLEDLN